MPGAGSEGVPKMCNIKMSPNAIPNNYSLAKDTLKSIDEAPVLAWEHLFVPRPKVRVGSKNS